MREVNDSNGVYLTLNLRQEKLEVRFPLKIDKEYHIFYFELPISQLSHMYLSRTSTTKPSITIPFARPPRFFVQKKPTRDDNSSFSKGRMWNIWTTMFRETDIVSGELKRELQYMPLMNNMGSAAIDIGMISIPRHAIGATSANLGQRTEPHHHRKAVPVHARSSGRGRCCRPSVSKDSLPLYCEPIDRDCTRVPSAGRPTYGPSSSSMSSQLSVPAVRRP